MHVFKTAGKSMAGDSKRKSCHSDHYLGRPADVNPTVSPTIIAVVTSLPKMLLRLC
jgi:hypothetical protein